MHFYRYLKEHGALSRWCGCEQGGGELGGVEWRRVGLAWVDLAQMGLGVRMSCRSLDGPLVALLRDVAESLCCGSTDIGSSIFQSGHQRLADALRSGPWVE